jgi:putative ABC transport system permease protein
MKWNLLIAYRNLVRNRFFSLINAIGLALGMVTGLFILLWVNDERQIDRFHVNGNALYAVYEKESHSGTVSTDYETSALLPRQLKTDMPEVQYATGMEEYKDISTFQAGQKIMKWYGNAGSADFFQMFSYSLIEGTPASALAGPESIAISKKMAEAFFGSPEKAIGQSLRYENKDNLKVTAVFDNIGLQSSRQFDFVLNWDAFVKNTGLQNWVATGPYTIVQLKPGADPALLEKKLLHYVYQFSPPGPGYSLELHLQPYSDIYLHNLTEGSGRITYVRLFMVVAFFVLLIACINFTSLSTARSVKRAKEIGVRKTIGALRRTLVTQFITESLLMTLVAVLLALLMLALALPAFNQLTQKEIALPFLQPLFWTWVLALTLVTGLVAGIYPALFLSSFNPMTVLKGRARLGPRSRGFLSTLVVVQFTLSIVLIVGTLVVSRQVNYLQTRERFDRGNLLYIPLEGTLPGKYDLLKSEVPQLTGVESLSYVSDFPSFMDDNTTDVSWEGKGADVSSQVAQAGITYDYVHTMHLTLVQGRDFSPAFPSDSAGYLINEAAARMMGYKDPVGKSMVMWGRRGTIVGVLKDFNYKPLHVQIGPLILYSVGGHPRNYGYLLVRTRPGQTQQALKSLEPVLKSLNPAFSFYYWFADQAYLAHYHNEVVIQSLSRLFAALAILISALGLLGLAVFATERRRKEIGIRKVLGAGAWSLFALVSTEFLLLLGLSLVIAVPLAWLGMHQWLQQYAYRVSIGWTLFGVAALLALFLTMATISFQILKAVRANPVKSLRTE